MGQVCSRGGWMIELPWAPGKVWLLSSPGAVAVHGAWLKDRDTSNNHRQKKNGPNEDTCRNFHFKPQKHLSKQCYKNYYGHVGEQTLSLFLHICNPKHTVIEDQHLIPLTHITNICIIKTTSTPQLNLLLNLFYSLVILTQSNGNIFHYVTCRGFVQQSQQLFNCYLQ